MQREKTGYGKQSPSLLLVVGADNFRTRLLFYDTATVLRHGEKTSMMKVTIANCDENCGGEYNNGDRKDGNLICLDGLWCWAANSGGTIVIGAVN
ncbi:hypothetical protein TSUD_374980 [Trifolium subterraneum]|uniref:Uncharacterized protein n=1 Tax=Trifolium subterraneum TaxID=3900 RepID=A0A2Z6NTP8_TRISU|nr:hypothetical protein TSUD_374980 [Trifolium subterraneum]